MASLLIGTSGWSYRHWQDKFYHSIKQKDRLRYYAETFRTVEVNGTFYRLQKTSTLQKWYDETSAEFRFAIKANRYLTHNKKLLAPDQSVLIEKAHAMTLRDKLAVVLWQLPITLAKDLSRLQRFLQALRRWNEVRHVIEFRDPSWFAEDTAEKLIEAGIAVCLSDAGDWPMWERVTTDFVYIRLHGNPQTYASSYTTETLRNWAGRIAQWLGQQRQVYVYFDNDAECAAPFNAIELQTILQDFAV